MSFLDIISYFYRTSVKRIMRSPLLWIGVFFVFAISCNKDDGNGQENLPIVSTSEVTEITRTTARSGGNITDDRGTSITARGVCWSTGQTPTISDNKTEDGTGAGSFTSSVTGLAPNTSYYLRAYATNSEGTGYGNAMLFTSQEDSSNTFTDPRDGRVYQTVEIGTQVWMAENLAYAPSGGDYWAYANDDANVEIYAYLYDWETALDVCPTGWHLPSDAEWTELTDFLGENAGGKLKSTGTIEAGTGLWYDPNTGATNEIGFSALPSGHFHYNGYFNGIGRVGCWWSATEGNSNDAWYRRMYCDYSYVSRYGINKESGFAVRCIKD
jgi:uncharacterized protein (TIGR02145 family)